jgi:hypothetical protein
MTETSGPDPTNPETPVAARQTPLEGESGEHFAAPLGSSRSGRLRFTNGAHRVVIRADSRLRSLYRASFGERMPVVGVRGGVVSIRYTRVASCDWTGYRLAEVALNAGIPWDVELRGGASRLLADLSGLRLGSLKVAGGAGRLELTLPAPSGAMIVTILGGATNVAIRRPTGVCARLRVEGGVTNLRFDDRHIGAAGGDLDLRSRDYEGAADRCDIAITGGANNVIVETQRGTTPSSDRTSRDSRIGRRPTP